MLLRLVGGQIVGLGLFFTVLLSLALFSPSIEEPNPNLGIVMLTLACLVAGYVAAAIYGQPSYLPVILLTPILLIICFVPWISSPDDFIYLSFLQRTLMVTVVLVVPAIANYVYKKRIKSVRLD